MQRANNEILPPFLGLISNLRSSYPKRYAPGYPNPGPRAQRAVVRDGRRLFESRTAVMHAEGDGSESRQVRRAAERRRRKGAERAAVRQITANALAAYRAVSR